MASRVLVVGGAGYIGSALIPAILKKTPYVTVVDTFWFGDHLPAHVKKIDDDAINLTEEELGKHDIVIFLAGASNDPMAEFAPFANYVANAALPSWLAFMSAKAKVKRFIHGGSCSIYGKADKVGEHSPPKTFSPYGVSKLMAEVGVGQQINAQMDVINFRMGTVCGWSPRMRFDLIINAMVKDAIVKRKIFVNDPVAERPILDIRDAVRAYVAAMDLDLKLTNRTLLANLVSENVLVLDIAKAVAVRVKTRFGFAPDIEMLNKIDIRSYTADASTVKWAMRFEPENKALDTIDYVISKFSTIKDPEDDIYYNIRVLKKIMAPEGCSQSSGQ